jgi:hypothetical protein
LLRRKKCVLLRRKKLRTCDLKRVSGRKERRVWSLWKLRIEDSLFSANFIVFSGKALGFNIVCRWVCRSSQSAQRGRGRERERELFQSFASIWIAG